jgi:O-antigen ligase
MTVSALAFAGLMAFTFVVFVAPQNFVPALESLSIGKLTLGAAMLGMIAARRARGLPLITWTPTARLMVAFLGVALVSIPLSTWPGGSLDALFDQFAKSIVLFFIVVNVVDSQRRMVVLTSALVAWITIGTFVVMKNYASGRVYNGRVVGYDAGLLSNPNDFGMATTVMFALAIGLYGATSRRLPRLLLLGTMGLFLVGIVLTFSRTAVLANVALAAVAWFRRSERRPAVLIVALAVLLACLPLLPASYVDRVSTILSPGADETGSATLRYDTMVWAFNYMLGHPLMGLGLGVHATVLANSLGHWGPVHNIPLQVGIELGIGGVAVWAAIVVTVLRLLSRGRRDADAAPDGRTLRALIDGVEMAFIAYLVGGMFEPQAYHFHFYYLAGFAVALAALAHQRVTSVTATAAAPAPRRWLTPRERRLQARTRGLHLGADHA